MEKGGGFRGVSLILCGLIGTFEKDANDEEDIVG
jgi:hypothetical protein